MSTISRRAPRTRKSTTHPRTRDSAETIPPLSRKQRRAIARSSTRVNLLEGSIRAGKTFVWLIRWLTFIDEAPKRGALIMVGKTLQSIYRNVFEPIENDPTLAVFAPFIQYKQGAPTAIILGRVVHIMGAADAKAESKLRGMTVAGAFVDEVTTLPLDFFKQLLGRMSVDGAQMFATTNPDAPGHWLKTEYLDKIGQFPDWLAMHFTMDDNPGLSPAFRESLEREYSGLWYRRFILGEWVAAEGAIFPEWAPETHVISRTRLPAIERVLIAATDYGTTHRTRAYLLGMGVDERDGVTKLFVLSEFAPGTATVGQHAAMYRSWLADCAKQGWHDPEWHAVDPAARVFKQQLFDDGMTNVMGAHNAVLPGIQTISSLLATGRLLVVDTCEQLIKMLPGYRWDSKATKRGATAPIKENDDEVDALRYAVYSSRRFWRDRIPLAPAKNEQNIEDEADERIAA